MRLRQIALVARHRDPVVKDLCHVLGIEVSVFDLDVAEFGLVNAVMPVGDTYIEVISPNKEGTTAERYIDRRKGDGGYMLLFQTDDLAVDKKRLSDLGVRLAWESEHDDVIAAHLHPRDTGGAITSLDQTIPPESWRWAGAWEDKVHQEVSNIVVGAEVQTDDPGALANRWAAIFDRDEPTEDDGVYTLAFDGSAIRFVHATDDRGEGLRGFDIAVNDPEEFLRRAGERNLECTDDAVKIGGAWFYIAKSEATV